jgi:ATP synthase protein I
MPKADKGNHPQSTNQSSIRNRELENLLQKKVDRKLRSRQHEDRNILFWMGMFGLVGWSIAIPTLIGTGLGVMIDKRWPGPASWTLMLLMAGIFLGCLSAWYWIKQEIHHD